MLTPSVVATEYTPIYPNMLNQKETHQAWSCGIAVYKTAF